MQNRAFRSIWFSTTVFFLAVVLNFSMAIHYFTWYAHISRSEVLSLIQSCFYVGAIGRRGFVDVAGPAHRKAHPLHHGRRRVCHPAVYGHLSDRQPGGLSAPATPWPLIVGHVVGGIFASAVWVVPASMIADVTDTDELATGLRREGIYFGIMNFGEKIAAGGALLFAGGLLACFPEDVAMDGSSALPAIRRPPPLTWVCYTALFRLCCCCSLLLFFLIA